MTDEERKALVLEAHAICSQENCDGEPYDQLQRCADAIKELMAENKRLRDLMEGAPDPAMYRPEEYEAAWLKWRRAALKEDKE